MIINKLYTKLIALTAVVSVVAVVLFVLVVQEEKPTAVTSTEPVSAATCDHWLESEPFYTNTTRSHPLPSFAAGNYYYVMLKTPASHAKYAEILSDGSLGEWKVATKGESDNSGRGYNAVSFDGTGYLLRYGRVLKQITSADGDIVNEADVGNGPNNVGGHGYYWLGSVLADFGATRWVYIFGGFDLDPHVYVFDGTYRSNNLASASTWSWTHIGKKFPGAYPYKGAFYKASDAYGFIYVADRDGTLYKIRVDSNGNLGTWSSAGVNFPSADRGDYFVANNKLWVIRGSKVYYGDIDSSSGNISAFDDSPPDLPGPQIEMDWGDGHNEGNSWAIVNDVIYVTGPDRVYYLPLSGGCTRGGGGGGWTPGVGGAITCNVKEWIANGPNVLTDPIICPRPEASKINPDYCAENPTDEVCLNPPPPSSRCVDGEKCKFNFQPDKIAQIPMDKDYGQHDGTGIMAGKRQYRYYDYDNDVFIDVPPYWFGSGGGSLIEASLTSTSPAPYDGLSDPSITDEAPCGWPTNTSHRNVYAGCGFPYTAHDRDTSGVNGICPEDMNPQAPISSCATEASNYHNTNNGTDITGYATIYATQKGTAYRCVDTLDTDYGAHGYGVFTVVRGEYFTTLSVHFRPVPAVDSVPELTDPNGSHLCWGTKLVKKWDVQRGDALGEVGLTGYTNGPHVHYVIFRNTLPDSSNPSKKLPDWNQPICAASFMDLNNDYCQGLPPQTMSANPFSSVGAFVNSINPFSSNTQESTPTQESAPDSNSDYRG